jgi:DNA-directed RNA polymerase subunit RPC12/RpoP
MKYCSKCGKELSEDVETPFNCPNCGRVRVTTTPPKAKQIFPIKKGRPQGVTLIAILNLIAGVAGTILGLIVVAMFSTGLKFGGLMGTFAAYLSLAGIAMFFVGLFSLFVGWGLWKGAEWAWTLTVILEIIGIIFGIMAIMVTPFAVAVLINGLILYYLFKPNVKEWFKKPSEDILEVINIKEEKVTKEEKLDPRTPTLKRD